MRQRDLVSAPPPVDASIIHGGIMHRRLRPARNEFRYNAFSLALPLSRLSELGATGIGWNRRAMISFYDRDHALVRSAEVVKGKRLPLDGFGYDDPVYGISHVRMNAQYRIVARNGVATKQTNQMAAE